MRGRTRRTYHEVRAWSLIRNTGWPWRPRARARGSARNERRPPHSGSATGVAGAASNHSAHCHKGEHAREVRNGAPIDIQLDSISLAFTLRHQRFDESHFVGIEHLEELELA